jgi:hypothetical protein
MTPGRNVRRQNSDADVRAGCHDGGAVAPPGWLNTRACRASANPAQCGGQLTLGMLIGARLRGFAFQRKGQIGYSR